MKVHDLLATRRNGTRPLTATIPRHMQTSQTAPRRLQAQLVDHVRQLPGVVLHDSITCRGSLAIVLSDDVTTVRHDAFIARREFAHIHPPYDGSLHVMLAVDVAELVVKNGWGEYHPSQAPRANAREVLVFGPTSEEELRVVEAIVDESYRFARLLTSNAA